MRFSGAEKWRCTRKMLLQESLVQRFGLIVQDLGGKLQSGWLLGIQISCQSPIDGSGWMFDPEERTSPQVPIGQLPVTDRIFVWLSGSFATVPTISGNQSFFDYAYY